MKKNYHYLVMLLIAAIVSVATVNAQDDVQMVRWVFGSGGMVGEVDSQDLSMSGIVGQFAIETVTRTDLDVRQGFWTGPDTIPFISVEETPVTLSSKLMNYPNPFSFSTTIKYTLPGNSRVTLKVYDLVGQVVKVLVDDIQNQGEQEVVWDAKDQNGTDVGSGSYIYELTVRPGYSAGGFGFKPYNLRNVMVIVK